jgi:hypothetical protein
MNSSLYKSITNAGKATGRIIKNVANNKPVIVDKSVTENREQICGKCEFLKGKRCVKCGCFYSLKITLATEKCPINKW